MYAKIENGAISKYPYNFNDLRHANPNTSFPIDSLSREDIRNRYNVVNVIEVERPSKPGWHIVEESPSFDGSVWTQNWSQTVKSIDELSGGDVTSVEPPVADGHNAQRRDPELVGDEWKENWELVENTWLENRLIAYGEPLEQLEFITENGLEAWQSKVAGIKAQYPKS